MNSEEELQKLRDYAEENFVPIIRPNSSQILVNLIKLYKPKTILEIGTAIGYSGILMLLNNKEAFLYTIEKDTERINLAKENFKKFGLENRVEILEGDANILVSTIRKNIDFVFLDGPKSHYIKQLPYLIERLNVGGVLLADNVLFMGEVLSDVMPKHKHRTAILRMRDFLDSALNDERLNARLIQVEDGLLLAEKVKNTIDIVPKSE